MIAAVADTIRKCREFTDDVEFIAEDATRSDMAFLRTIITEAISAGARTITLCDTAGAMLPDETAAFIASLYEGVEGLSGVTVGFFCTDQMNMADACAVSAVRAGIREIKAASFRTNAI
ncbi:hypothetical protein RCJ22_06870, partial [Vibrio sp. FNV 38]|nr:hypothetical protein [Vibrio sp. FNV 38]